jgi:protein-S-isoprenylcysteine O-methyltransferase Ste14
LKTKTFHYKDLLFVALQVFLFVGYALPLNVGDLNLPRWTGMVGLAIAFLFGLLGIVALLQLNTRISPFPTPVHRAILVTKGVFYIARHPIYTSIMGVSAGYALFQESVYQLAISGLLMLLFWFKSSYEEQLLQERFPEYATYKRQVYRFLGRR